MVTIIDSSIGFGHSLIEPPTVEFNPMVSIVLPAAAGVATLFLISKLKKQ
jgi:hypothetical protein